MQKVAAICLSLVAVAVSLAGLHAQSSSATDSDEDRIQDVITASHILTNEGILDSFGHVSARSDKNRNHFFMPRAMPPALVSRADMVEVDLDCKPVTPDAPRLNGERYIHCEVYKARDDVQSVIHTHDFAVLPFGLAGISLKPVLAQAGFLPPETPLFEVRDANQNQQKRGMLVLDADLGHGKARIESCRFDARPRRYRGWQLSAGSNCSRNLHPYRRSGAKRGTGSEPEHHGARCSRAGERCRGKFRRGQAVAELQAEAADGTVNP